LKSIPDITKSWFGWREFLGLQRDLLSTYEAWQHGWGDAVQLRFLGQRHIVLYAPQAVGEVLKHADFVRYPRMMRVLRQVMGDSVSSAEGAHWQERRRLLAPAFRVQHVQSYAQSVERIVEEAFGDPEINLRVVPAMTELTLRVICGAVLDLQPGNDISWVGVALQSLGKAAMVELFLPAPLPDWLPIPFVRRKRRAIRQIQDFVADLTQRGGRHFLARLEGLSPLQVRDETLNLILAGHETTAAGLSWALYLLATHPQVAQRVAVEGLGYCERVVKETLRLYPPAPALFLRQAQQELRVDNYEIPRGSIVHLPAWAVHRDSRYFEDPLKFNPDRFAPEAVKQRPEFSYFPFGGGPRICLGQSFALLEMSVILTVLLRKYHIETLDVGASPLCQVRFSLWPGWPLELKLRRRENLVQGLDEQLQRL